MLRGVVALGIAEALGLACGLALHGIAARRLGPSDYGRFAQLSILGIALTLLADVGLIHGLRALVSLSPNNLGESVRRLAREQFPLAFALGAALLLLSGPLSSACSDPALKSSLRLLAADISLRSAFLEPGLALMNGLSRQGLQAAILGCYQVGRVTCVAALLGRAPTVSSAVAGTVLATAFTGLLLWATLCWFRQATVDTPSPDFIAQLGRFRRSAGYDALFYVTSATNLWIVNGFVSDAEEVGRYSACFALSQPLSALGRMIGGGTLPWIYRAYAFEGPRRTVDLACYTLQVALPMPLLAVTIAWSNGPILIRLAFGPAFSEAGSMLGVTMIGTGALALAMIMGDILGAVGRLAERSVRVAVAAASGCVLGVAGIITFGPAGAPWGLAATGILAAVSLGLGIRRVLGPFLPWRSAATCASAAVAIGMISITFGPASDPRGVVIRVATLSLVFFAALASTGGFSRCPGLAQGDSRIGRHT
jgi:O-antigen/teichoic acid export membrane protein